MADAVAFERHLVLHGAGTAAAAFHAGVLTWLVEHDQYARYTRVWSTAESTSFVLALDALRGRPKGATPTTCLEECVRTWSTPFVAAVEVEEKEPQTLSRSLSARRLKMDIIGGNKGGRPFAYTPPPAGAPSARMWEPHQHIMAVCSTLAGTNDDVVSWMDYLETKDEVPRVEVFMPVEVGVHNQRALSSGEAMLHAMCAPPPGESITIMGDVTLRMMRTPDILVPPFVGEWYAHDGDAFADIDLVVVSAQPRGLPNAMGAIEEKCGRRAHTSRMLDATECDRLPPWWSAASIAAAVRCFECAHVPRESELRALARLGYDAASSSFSGEVAPLMSGPFADAPDQLCVHIEEWFGVSSTCAACIIQ
jgi:hypothetical protein